jgi:hypothetical protein
MAFFKLFQRKKFWFLAFCLLVVGETWAFELPQKSAPSLKQNEVVAFAQKNLPTQGILKKNQDGYVYLKIPDRYVKVLFPLIKEPGFAIPYAIRRHTKIGAHISVFYKGETAPFGQMSEIGKVYSFEPKSIKRVRAGRKEYIILEVFAPGLENLRKRYGLPPKLLNHEFHITLAEKRIGDK